MYLKCILFKYAILLTKDKSMSKMMRISMETAESLDELAEICGASKTSILEKAVKAFLKEQFLKKAAEDAAYIRANPELWAIELAERKEWDATLADGLEDE
jgi:predicted transcriptional regulator